MLIRRPLSEAIEPLKCAREHEEISGHLLRQSPLTIFDDYLDMGGGPDIGQALDCVSAVTAGERRVFNGSAMLAVA